MNRRGFERFERVFPLGQRHARLAHSELERARVAPERKAPVGGHREGRRGLRGVGDIGRHAHAALKLGHELRAVLKIERLDREGVPLARGHGAHKLRAGDIADGVDAMNGDVVDRAAVLARFEIPHRAHAVGERVLAGKVDRVDRAQPPLAHQPPRQIDRGVIAQIEHALHAQALFQRKPFDLVQLELRDAQRLIADHALAGLQRADDAVAANAVIVAHGHSVDGFVGKQRVKAVIKRRVHARFRRGARIFILFPRAGDCHVRVFHCRVVQAEYVAVAQPCKGQLHRAPPPRLKPVRRAPLSPST